MSAASLTVAVLGARCGDARGPCHVKVSLLLAGTSARSETTGAETPGSGEVSFPKAASSWTLPVAAPPRRGGRVAWGDLSGSVEFVLFVAARPGGAASPGGTCTLALSRLLDSPGTRDAVARRRPLLHARARPARVLYRIIGRIICAVHGGLQSSKVASEWFEVGGGCAVHVSASLRLPMSVGAATTTAQKPAGGTAASDDASAPASEFAEAARTLMDEPAAAPARGGGGGSSRSSAGATSGTSTAEARLRAAFERAPKPVKVAHVKGLFLEAGITARIPQVRARAPAATSRVLGLVPTPRRLRRLVLRSRRLV
jgi:hypothetical protein